MVRTSSKCGKFGLFKLNFMPPPPPFPDCNTCLNSLMAMKWNYAQRLKQPRRGALLFFKVICQIFRSHGTKKSPILTWIERFWTVTQLLIHWWIWSDAQSLAKYSSKRCSIIFQGLPSNFEVTWGKKSQLLTQFERFRIIVKVWIHRWLWNDAQSLTWYRRGALFFSRSTIKCQGHTGWKMDDNLIWVRLLGRSELSIPQICLVYPMITEMSHERSSWQQIKSI